METPALRLMLAAWLVSATACANGTKVGPGLGGSGGYDPSGSTTAHTSVGTGNPAKPKSGVTGTSTTGVTTGAVTTAGVTTGASTSVATTSTTAATTTATTGGGCTDGTRITYGPLWLPPGNHPAQFDDIVGSTITWDGACAPTPPTSFAKLSNGWQPTFQTATGCVMAFDPLCPKANPPPCMTRITYGSTWLAQANHPDAFDDVVGKVTWAGNGGCTNTGAQSYATLSNGWQPYFQGNDACEISFRYENCGGV